VLIETSGGNSPKQVVIDGGIIEGCTPGISVTAGLSSS
jgi:hypothetical protein